MAHSPYSRQRGDRHFGVTLPAPPMRLAAPIAGDAAGATQRSTPPNERRSGRLTAFYNFCSRLQTAIDRAYTISRHRCAEVTQTWSTVG